MALDYFRSVPARLQQRGLQGLATDQREIDADAQRRKEEEERAKQLEQIKAQYDEATAQATQQAQGLTLRDSILGQARERFEELTGGVGQAVQGAGEALGNLGEARDEFMQRPARDVAPAPVVSAIDRAGESLGQTGAAVGNAIGQYGDWREEIQAQPDQTHQQWREEIQARPRPNAVMQALEGPAGQAAGQAVRGVVERVAPDLDEAEALGHQQRQQDIEAGKANVPQEPVSGLEATAMGLRRQQGWDELQQQERDQQRAYDEAVRTGDAAAKEAAAKRLRDLTAERGGILPSLAGQVGRTIGQGLLGATGADPNAPGSQYRPTEERPVLEDGKYTGRNETVEAPQGLARVRRDVPEQYATLTGQGKRNENLAERAQAGFGLAMAPFNVTGELAAGAAGEVSDDEVIAAQARLAGDVLGLGGPVREFGAAGKAAWGGLKAARAGGTLEDVIRGAGGLREAAKAAGIGSGVAVAPGAGVRAYQDAREAGLSHEEALARAIEMGGNVAQMGEIADLGVGAASALRKAPGAPRAALSAAGQITPDMSLGEGLRGAAGTAGAQARAAGRSLMEGPTGRLLREERGELGRAQPEPTADPEALKAELVTVNQARAQAAQALGKARLKVGPPDKPPAGLTPETQGIWDAYASSARRAQQIQTEISRAKQGATQAAETQLGEPTGRPPEGVPRQGRGSFQEPGVTYGRGQQGMTWAPQGDLLNGQQAPFFSALQRAVTALPAGKLAPNQLARQLLAQPDVKKEQLVWSGVEDYLTGKLQANNGRGEAVTKEELATWLQEHDVRVYEVQKGQATPVDANERARLEYEQRSLQNRAEEAQYELGSVEQRGENEAFLILARIQDRMGQTPEGQRALEQGSDQGSLAAQVMFGYSNLPKDVPFFQALERESGGTGGEGWMEPVLAAATPEERAQLEAIRQEWQDASDAHTAILDALDANEASLRDAEGSTLPGGPTKWVDYADGGLNLPGIEEPDANPREFLLTLGPRADMPQFTESHWDEPNVIAHIRMSSRMTPDGKRVLMIEELQSDWHQKGRAVVKDSAGKPVIDPATGKPKRKGYYPGRRGVEEMRASPEYAERARLTQAVTEASAAREAFHRSGRLDDARRALRLIQAAGYEVAIEKARAAGIPEEFLPTVNESSKLLDRAQTASGFGSVTEPTILVRTTRPPDLQAPRQSEILEWTPGYTRYGDPEEAGVNALIQRSAELNAEESRMWALVRERGEEPGTGQPRYEYTTRPLYNGLIDVARNVPEVVTAQNAADAVENEFRALDKAYDEPTQALSNLNARHGDLSQVDATDRQRAVQARIAELEADPDIRHSPRYWQDRVADAIHEANRARPEVPTGQVYQQPDIQALMAEAREATGGAQTVEAAQRNLTLTAARVGQSLKNFDPEAIRTHPDVIEAIRAVDEAERRGHTAPPEAEAKYDALQKLRTEQRNLASSLEYGAQKHYPAGRPPAGPFQGEGWQRLALKRMLHLASTEGFDFLGLTPGEVHAFRYDPFGGMGVERLEYHAQTGKLIVDRGGNYDAHEETVKPEELHLYVGNEVADALLSEERVRQGGGVAVITKEDWQGGLAVESEMGVGHRKSYDQILPGVLSDLGRRFGAEVRVAPQTDPNLALQQGDLESGVLLYPNRPPEEMVLDRNESGDRRERPNFQPAHLIEVTPEMRQAMAEPGAQPLFQITPGGAMSGAGTAGGALSEGAAALEEEEGEELTPEERLKRGLAGVGTGALIGGLGTRRGRRALSRGGDVLRLLNQEETGGIKLKPLPGPITGPVTAFGQPARGVDPETGEPRAAPPTAGERFREGQGIAQPYGAFEPESPEAQVTDAMDAKAEQAETAGAGLAQVREAEAAYARDGDTEALKAATDAYYPSPDELEILPGAPPTVHKYGGARSFFDLLRFLDAGKEGLNWYETMSGKLRGQTSGRSDIWQESLAFFGRTGQRTTPEVNHELTFAAILARDDLDKAGKWPLADGEEGAAVLRKAMRPYIGLTSGPEAGSVDAAAVRTEIEARKERQAKAPDEDPEKAPRTPEEDEAVADGDADGDDLDIPEVGSDGDPNVPTTGKVLQALIQMWNTGETSIDKNLKLASYTEALTGPARGRLAMTSVPDVWMFFAFGFEDTGKIASDPEASRYVQAVVKRLADERGLAPAQAQAAIWTGARKLAESDPDLQREVFKRFEIPKREKNVLAAETKATQARFARAITPPIQRITEPLLRGEEKQAYRELSQARAPQQQTRALSQRSVEEAQSAHAQAKADVASAREAVKAAGKDKDAKAQAKQGVVEALARQDEAKAAMGEAREAHKAVLEGTAGPVKDAEKAYQAKRREMLKAMGGVKLRRGAEGEPALPGGPPTPSGATHQAVTEAEAKIRAAQTETLNRKPPATIYSTAKRYRLNGYEGDIPDLKTPQGLAEWLGKTGTPASVEKANEALLAHVKERLPDLAPPPREMTVAHRTEQLKGLPYRQEPATVEAGARRAEQQGRRVNVSSPFHAGEEFTKAAGITPPPGVSDWTPEQRLQKTLDWLTKVWGYDPTTKQLTKLPGIRHTVYPDQMGSWEQVVGGVPTVATEHNVRIVFPTATAAQHRVLGALFGKAGFQDKAGLYRARVDPSDAEQQAQWTTPGAAIDNVALIRHPEGKPWDRAEIERLFGEILPGFELGPQGQLYVANYEPWSPEEPWKSPKEFTAYARALVKKGTLDPNVLVYFESADISAVEAKNYDAELAALVGPGRGVGADVGRGADGLGAGAPGPAGPSLAPTGGVDDLFRQSVEYHRGEGWDIPDDYEARARAFWDSQGAQSAEPGGAPGGATPGAVAPEAPTPPGATVPNVLRNLGAVASRLAGEETGAAGSPGAMAELRGQQRQGAPPVEGAPPPQSVEEKGSAAKPAGRTPPPGKLEKASDFVQRYRYANALGNPANALWDVLSTLLNIPRLAVRTGLGTGNERLMGVPREARATTIGELQGMWQGIHSGTLDALGGVFGALLEGAPPVATEQAQPFIRGKKGLLLGELGTRIRTANDGFTTHLGQNMAAHMLGHREAFREGLTGDAYAKRVFQVTSAIKQRFAAAKEAGEPVKQGGTALPLVEGQPTVYGARDTADYDALAREAQGMTKRLVFQQEAGSSAEKLGGARGNSLLGWFVMFFKTLANIGAEGLTMTPVGYLGSAGDLARGSQAGRGLAGEKWRGPYADQYAQAKAEGEVPTNQPGDIRARTTSPAVLPFSQRLAEHELGVALIAAGAALGTAGLLTGEGPEGATANEQWREEGHRKYALKIKGEDVPIIRLLGPLALPLIMGAVGAEHFQETGEYDADLMGDVVMTTSGEWAKLSGLGAFADVFAALMEPDDEKKWQLVQRAAAQNAGSLIPMAGLLRAIEQVTDVEMRDPRTFWERIASGVPALAQGLPTEKDELGNVVRRGTGERGARALLPFQSSKPKRGLRRFPGSKDAGEDARIAKALSKVATYDRLEKEGLPVSQADYPSREDFAMADFYKGEESEDWQDWRTSAREQERQRKGMGDQALAGIGKLLGRGGQGGGGLPTRRVTGPAALLLRGGR